MEPYPTPNLVQQSLEEILNKLDFVDKIVFGKLNYNVKVSEFQDNKEFYNECANVVMDFCDRRNIEYHIKYGTAKKDNKATEKIFKKKLVVENKLNYCTLAQTALNVQDCCSINKPREVGFIFF